MLLSFKNKRITGIITIVPEQCIKFEDEIHQYNFPPARSMKLKEVMGYHSHHIAPDGVTGSDMIIAGFNHLIKNTLIDINEIDALLYISHTPDYVIPPTSSVIQGKLNMKKSMFCLDINQGCAGFLFGLLQSFFLLDNPAIKKVAILNADTFSRKVSKKDRNSYPLIGDAASITIVENGSNDIYASVYMDGSEHNAVIIPAGGSRMPSSPATAVLHKDKEGNERALDHLVMQGIGVFNFIQTVVPEEIVKAMTSASVTDNDIFAYCFHQPNKFLLAKLADKMNVAKEKMPSNIVEFFGNSNSVTIPMVMVYNYKEILKHEDVKLCISGFGDGLACSTIIMNVGNLKFCEMIEYQ